MVAATKNKRGRPKSWQTTATETAFPEKEIRAGQNYIYASEFIHSVLGERPGQPGNFFVTDRGNIRRQGIAEQLGRMYAAGLIDEEQGKELAQTVIDLYNSGESVKQLETRLRRIRIDLQKGG